MAKKIKQPAMRSIQLFDHKYGFMEVVKYYNDIKVGYDGMISNYGRVPYANYVPKNRFGAVRVKYPLSLKRNIQARFQRIKGIEEALEWKFSIPVQKGFKIEAKTTLSSWNEEEVLASSFTTGKYISMEDISDNINSFSFGEAYGYMEISLSHDKGDKEYLQDKLQRWFDKGSPVTNRLMILRVNQFVYPHKKGKDMITSVFAPRQDSIILEIES